MRIAQLLIIVLAPALLRGQDLTGTWEGSGGGSNYARICIVRINDTYIGYTYDEGMGFCKANFTGHFNIADKKLRGVNDGMIRKSAFHSQSRYNLTYSASDGREYLKGTASAKSIAAKIGSFGIPQFVSYTKVSNNVDTTDYMFARLKSHVVPGNNEMAGSDTITSAGPVAKAPQTSSPDTVEYRPDPTTITGDAVIIKEKNKRVTDTLSVIDIGEKEMLIKVVDNGVVDGDTVSIIHNGKVIAERISVKETPWEIRVSSDTDNSLHEIILVAHNTGNIPPNTALILIETPSKQYRLTASTNLIRNAMIIFRYKEKR